MHAIHADLYKSRMDMSKLEEEWNLVHWHHLVLVQSHQFLSWHVVSQHLQRMEFDRVHTWYSKGAHKVTRGWDLQRGPMDDDICINSQPPIFWILGYQ